MQFVSSSKYFATAKKYGLSVNLDTNGIHANSPLVPSLFAAPNVPHQAASEILDGGGLPFAVAVNLVAAHHQVQAGGVVVLVAANTGAAVVRRLSWNFEE